MLKIWYAVIEELSIPWIILKYLCLDFVAWKMIVLQEMIVFSLELGDLLQKNSKYGILYIVTLVLNGPM